ncbi:TPA: tetratricopeptide repeat protein [Elizabethkingia anophelis]|nr:tetratricopeptide repeat protein [Elizabethkingia anophelis]HAT3997863.1 tetratricopeptide repeat protein [Elizabethkingia anophelis]HAT4005464.1 tetratricopeptide repeat protein [Elizabethkingia anophelis]
MGHHPIKKIKVNLDEFALSKNLSTSQFIKYPTLSSKPISEKDNEVDRLLRLSDSTYYINSPLSLTYAKRAILKAQEQNSSIKRAEAYYYTAKNLFLQGEYEESYHYIEKGMSEKSFNENFFLTVLFKELKVFCYYNTHLLSNQLKECQSIINLINSREDYKNDIRSKLLLSNIYIFIGQYYIEKQDYKKAHLYINKSIKTFDTITDKEYFSSKKVYWHKPYVYLEKSIAYLKQNNYNSALTFLNKAYNQALLEKHKYTAPFLEFYGDYYFQTKEYNLAIKFYLQAIENKKAFGKNISDLNLKISQSYNFWGKYPEQEQYQNIYIKIHPVEDNKMDNIVSTIVDGISKEHKEREIKKISKKNHIILFIVITSIMLIVWMIYIYKKTKRKNIKAIRNRDHLLFNKEQKIIEKKKKIERLQKQMNESFAEVIQLGKDNSQQFWPRFREVYPELYEKMLIINPKIKTTELTFCAYLYLGFTTKEIADYTFVTIRGVETRKNRLRKKYNIPSDMDFSIWLKDIESKD